MGKIDKSRLEPAATRAGFFAMLMMTALWTCGGGFAATVASDEWAVLLVMGAVWLVLAGLTVFYAVRLGRLQGPK
ncbi:hypothetical protein [Longispora albida]|uniref:hypothetical protein n=1 Tax=Longispora albida TaxID=203523 RepID=UPI00037FB49A|nr:hypothetical protein [Longispora albida]